MQPPIDDPRTGKARPSRNVIRAGALIAVLVMGALWFSRGPATDPAADGSSQTIVPSPDPTGTPDGGPVVATRRGVNRAGGYHFRYPRRWRLRREAGVTIVRAPGSRTAVTLGPGERIAARRLATRVFDVIEALPTYRRVRVTGRERQRFAGGGAYLISGTAVNQHEVRIRILVIGVDKGRRAFPVTIFTATDTDPSRVLPRVEAIARSVAPLRRG